MYPLVKKVRLRFAPVSNAAEDRGQDANTTLNESDVRSPWPDQIRDHPLLFAHAAYPSCTFVSLPGAGVFTHGAEMCAAESSSSAAMHMLCSLPRRHASSAASTTQSTTQRPPNALRRISPPSSDRHSKAEPTSSIYGTVAARARISARSAIAWLPTRIGYQ